ncbi:MAG: c-type cytochrome [Solirubrobacterales bacterium]
MPSKTPGARAAPVALAMLAVAALMVLAGCDLQENADREKGRMLFQQKCGVCHTLAEAGTSAQIGPNLDDAFAQARATGADRDTIEGVVTAQVENPRPASPDNTDVYMPAKLVEGQDLEDVTSYVGSVAGIPGIKPPKLPPPELFAQQCGICHALNAAGTTANTGPALDNVLPGQSAAMIHESIINPGAMISPGYGPGIMPSNFAQTLTPDDLNGLVKYLQQSVGGG